jgi:hydroxymethylbilane synthase
VIRIVTRNSKLALWQAEHVRDRLNAQGLASELIPITTKGDKILNVTLSKIGSKGVFTEELESMLASGEADIAVHSAKDLQSTLPIGFEIIAFTEREKVNDVMISDHLTSLQEAITIGTSSTRRVAYLKHMYPHLKIVNMRGNLQTRIEKMRRGDCDALLLAYAGVFRMGYQDMIAHTFPVDNFTPAVGQGSLAIECHSSLPKKIKEQIHNILNHDASSLCLRAERSYLAEMNGGCSIPVFGNATISNGEITLNAGIIDLEGQNKIQEHMTGTQPDLLGQAMGRKILSRGGEDILKEIKAQLNQT